MLIGRDYEVSTLENLRAEGRLSGSFLFFGGKGVGKFSCAFEIARKLEGVTGALSECLIVKPDEKGSIGVDAVREMKLFLSFRPANSPSRVVIVDDADKLTDIAANAALKITEEPPAGSLIILIARDPDSLPATLLSRLKKIYFPPVNNELIASWLMEEYKAEESVAYGIARKSFGRPEFALEQLIAMKKKRKAKQDFKFESDDEYESFIRNAVATLYNDKEGNFRELRELCRRIEAMGEWNTNKKLQLQTIKWTL